MGTYWMNPQQTSKTQFQEHEIVFFLCDYTLPLLQHELHVVDHGVVPAEDLVDVQLLRLVFGDGRGHVAAAAKGERDRVRVTIVVTLPLSPS